MGNVLRIHYNVISASKKTDTYIYEMCHAKREDIAAKVDAKRLNSKFTY
jgi:hypothetical protein